MILIFLDVNSGIISKADDNCFHFDKMEINQQEYDFYRDHDTEEKVMIKYAGYYRYADPWELFPTIALSKKDTEASAEREKQRAFKLARAQMIGSQMMSRIGSTHVDGEEVIQRGANLDLQSDGVKEIASRMKRRYAGNKNDDENSNRTKAFKATHICDVSDCNNDALSRNCEKSKLCKSTYRFCDVHKEHAIHSKSKKKPKRVKIGNDDTNNKAVTKSSVEMNFDNFDTEQSILEHLLKVYGFVDDKGINFEAMRVRAEGCTLNELINKINRDLLSIENFQIKVPDTNFNTWKENLLDAKQRITNKIQGSKSSRVGSGSNSASKIKTTVSEVVEMKVGDIVQVVAPQAVYDESIPMDEPMSSDVGYKLAYDKAIRKYEERFDAIFRQSKPHELSNRLRTELDYAVYVTGLMHAYQRAYKKKWEGNGKGVNRQSLVNKVVEAFLKDIGHQV